MNILLSTEVLAGILVGLLVLTLGLIIIQVWSTMQIRRMSKTTYQDDIFKAKNKAAGIVAQAEREAEEVLVGANQISVKAMAEASREAQKTTQSYQAELSDLIVRYNEELEAAVKRGDATFAELTRGAAASFNERQDELNSQFDDVLQSLSKVAGTLNTQTVSAMSSLETGIEEATSTLEQMLQAGEIVVRQRVEEHLEKLLDRAEADVEGYKKARVTLLDRHIERLVEDIAIRVLHKKRTLDEHGELAQQAVADAKEGNIL